MEDMMWNRKDGEDVRDGWDKKGGMDESLEIRRELWGHGLDVRYEGRNLSRRGIHTYTHTRMHAYVHTCMHACVHACMHTHIYDNDCGKGGKGAKDYWQAEIV